MLTITKEFETFVGSLSSVRHSRLHLIVLTQFGHNKSKMASETGDMNKVSSRDGDWIRKMELEEENKMLKKENKLLKEEIEIYKEGHEKIKSGIKIVNESSEKNIQLIKTFVKNYLTAEQTESFFKGIPESIKNKLLEQ